MLHEYVHLFTWKTVSPKKHLFLFQVSDTRLTELAARVDHLQKSGESSITQDLIPADVILTVDTVAKDLNRYFTFVFKVVFFRMINLSIYSQYQCKQLMCLLKDTAFSFLTLNNNHYMISLQRL